ncbi:4Fe-4S dicluster domain-containing protein [Demequina lutea]|uniref:Formate hydrogenlyase subunit 6/NADH:ubiquinone oxidoreductase subunit I n=1 Tax=Demequina lutea TaxID=431489 RepID=A0A7Z0CJ56_9MICO|nr:4Fe-4S dicluster domain-containing protein [Demequina lutea]NYI42674.1 formate hydrogenlyase subunit 6/NADH:ubiquinone oxidoreductase subunit I [Demequina lutea]
MGDIRIFTAADLGTLIAHLRTRGYRVMGPTRRGDAIVTDEIRSIADLPHGVGDTQGPANYRLTERDDGAYFGFAAPAQSSKPVFFPSEEVVWRGRRDHEKGGHFTVERDTLKASPVALLGVRSCDLRAVQIHDRVLSSRQYKDAHYTARRGGTLVIAVACGEPADTCFCASMGTGPRPAATDPQTGEPAYDLLFTEVLDKDNHHFVVEIGTDAGREVADAIEAGEGTGHDQAQAIEITDAAAARQTRRIDRKSVHDVLRVSAESPRWDDVASRCLACTNCTMVCPTCFCTTVSDVSDLTGENAERHRVWDSCFSSEFSYVHGGPTRESTKARYRQWITHKLSSWEEQFGMLGCVGCGRCITWCPAGIDITEEAAALGRMSGLGSKASAAMT